MDNQLIEMNEKLRASGLVIKKVKRKSDQRWAAFKIESDQRVTPYLSLKQTIIRIDAGKFSNFTGRDNRENCN